METRDPDIAFTRNPIRFTHTGEGAGNQRFFTVRVGGATAYTGHCSPSATIDVGEICEAFVLNIPDPEEGCAIGESETMLQLEGEGEFQGRLVVVAGGEPIPYRPPFYALPGGVSPQNYKRLAQLDTDIFAARLLDKKHNFFLTTRTHGWQIVMDELEVYPLTFVNLDDYEDSFIVVRAAGTEYSVTMETGAQGIYAIDLPKIRRKIAAEEGFLSSVFDVLCDGYLACRIVIKETMPERETTLVKFRNSLGAFELIHLAGARQTKSAPEETKNTDRRYDDISGRFERISARRAVSRTIEAYTGFKDIEEFQFILDMAASEEVYLRRDTGWTRVIPSIEDLSAGDPQLKPTSVKVSFILTEEHDSQTPDINSLDDFERPRIFSDQHTDEFN